VSALGLPQRLRVLRNVLKRIHTFKKMYPLRVLAQEAVLFPLDYRFGGRNIRAVRNVAFQITQRCNLRCAMCIFQEKLDRKTVLPLESYQRVIDLTAGSHPSVSLSGGEPATHPDLVAMVRYAKGRGLPVQIFTNGTLLVPRLADELFRAGLDYLNFSLLGSETSHPAVAGVPRSYELFSENFGHACRNRGRTAIVLSYTICSGNLGEIRHAVEVARRHRPDILRFQHYNFLTPAERQAQQELNAALFGEREALINNPVDTIANASRAVPALTALMAELGDEVEGIQVQWAPGLLPEEIRNWYGEERFASKRRCPYPWRSIVVEADGRIFPCPKLGLALGTFDGENLFEVWNCGEMKTFRKRLRDGLLPVCSRCCAL